MIAISLVFFLGAFLEYTRPQAGGDFWFHINSGRWIFENRALPDEDPFTYTVSGEDGQRESLILKSYWLAQVVIYLAFRALGYHGVVILKGVVFTLALYVLFKNLRRGQTDASLSLLAVSVVFLSTLSFVETRPQAVSYLMIPVALSLLDRGRERIMAGERPYGLFALPALMALWANMHPGYVIGFCMLAIYAAGEVFDLARRRHPRPSQGYKMISFIFISMALTAANPNAVGQITWVFRELGAGTPTATIDEYLSPVEYAALVGDWSTVVGIGIVGAFSIVSMIAGRRSLRPIHMVLFVGFAVAAMRSYRFAIMFMAASVYIASAYSGGIRLKDILRKGAVAVSALLALLSLYMGGRDSALWRGPVDESGLPVAAVGALERYGFPAEIFNPYEWGGYISWRLYPGRKTFVDARTIDVRAHNEYLAATNGDLGVLDRRGVNTVVFYTFAPMRFGGLVPEVVMALQRSPGWRLVYFDDLSVIYARAGAGRRILPLDKRTFTEHMLELAGRLPEGPGKERLIERLDGLVAG